MSIAARRKKIGKYVFVVIILAAIIITQSLSTSGISTTPPAGNYVNVMDMGATGDGTTNDIAAIRLALSDAQTYGMDLYFPAGTYNFNGGTLTANENLRIFGDGDSTVLYNPGQITCKKDIALEDVTVYKETGIFISLQPLTTIYADVYVNNVKAYNGLDDADWSFGFIYCLIENMDSDRGVENVVFTNNEISNCQYGLRLMCKVRTGAYVANNNIHDLSHSDPTRPLYGIIIGHAGTVNYVNNIVITNNTITDMFVPTGVSEQSGYGILVEGRNIQILDNYLENLEGWTGIYTKGYEIVIKGNTAINAGRQTCICVKCWTATDEDVLIENNTISSVLDDTTSFHVLKTFGILLEASNFTVRNNSISALSEYTGSIESTAISMNSSSAKVRNGIIEGNTIYTERSFAILVNGGMTGHLTIDNNTITQHMQATSTSGGKLLYFKGIESTSVIDCKDNTIDIDRGFYLSFSNVNSSEPGSILNFTGNTVEMNAFSAYALTMSHMTCNMLHNTITLNAHPTSTSQTLGLLSGGNPSIPYRVEDNIISCNAPDTSYLFTMPTSFTMTGNQIRFAPGSALLSVVNYNPAANAVSGDVTTITNNTIGRIDAGLLSGNTAANADYFVRFVKTNGYTFPEVNISDNTAVVKQRLINRPTTGGGISNAGTVSVTDNLIYSELGSNESAVINPAILESNLVLDNNWRAAGVEDITNS